MPTVIDGRYEIVSKVGQGGMGTVFKARHLMLETTVALKILPEHLADSPDLVARFQREARVMAQLRQENIVRVFDVAREGNLYYLVEEFVDGENLSSYVKRRGALPLSEAIGIVTQVARGLAHAHARNVVHRDIKPSNVLMETAPPHRILVADFGIAKVEDLGEHTQTGTVLGSIKYSAPEQLGFRIDGQRVPVDARADIYALGLVLYELCEGAPFFRGLEPTEVLAQVLYDREPLTPSFSTPVPSALVALVTRALSRDPAARQPNMEAFLDELRPLEESLDPDDDLPTLAVPPPPRQAPAPPPPPTIPAAEETVAVHPEERTVRLEPWAGAGPSARRPVRVPEPPEAPLRIAPESPQHERPPATRRAAWVVGGVLAIGALAAAAWLLLRTPPVAPLRWADFSPVETEKTVQAGESMRFTARVRDADQHPNLRLVWQIDGERQAEGERLEFRPPAGQGGVRDVTVTATAGSESVEHRWRVQVATPPPAPTPAPIVETPPPPAPAPIVETPPAPVPAALAIVARNPAEERITLEPGQRIDFGVQTTDAAVGYEWSLDGKTIGRDPTQPFNAPKDATAPVSHRLEVVVARQLDGATARAVWSLEMATTGPRIGAVEPRTQTVALDAGTSVTFRITPAEPIADGPLRPEWSLDGKVASSRPEVDAFRAKVSAVDAGSPPPDVASWPVVPGRHVVQVALIDAHGRRSAPQRWVVNARPAAVPATATAPPAEPPGTPPGRLSEADARDWVAGLRTAWERKDVALLRSLGIPAADRNTTEVLIGDASIIVDPRGALISFDYSVQDKSGASHHRHETVRIEPGAHGVAVDPGSIRQADGATP